MFEVVSDHVFPFLRTLGGDGSTYAHHMKDARFFWATGGAADSPPPGRLSPGNRDGASVWAGRTGGFGPHAFTPGYCL